MDDELPIVIYIGTQVKVPNLFAELSIVDEYIRTNLRDDFFKIIKDSFFVIIEIKSLF